VAPDVWVAGVLRAVVVGVPGLDVGDVPAALAPHAASTTVLAAPSAASRHRDRPGLGRVAKSARIGFTLVGSL
jgi:hypothetical protein